MFGYVYQNTNGQNHGPEWKIQSFLLNETCTVILWQDYYGKGNFEKVKFKKYGWEKVPNWECIFVNREKGLFLSVYVDEKNWQERNRTLTQCGKYSWRTLIWENRHHSLTMFFLGCTQRECQTSKDVVDNCRNMCESRISAGATEKLPCSGKPEANISSWSYDMEGHAKKSVERYCELANKTTQQLHKVATPCIDDHQVKEEEKGSVGELSKVCSQIVLKSLYLARIGWPDILWSVKKLARAITKWTRACNKCLARVISYIRHTCEFKQYCHVGNRAQQCRLGLFQDSDFAGDLEGSKSASGWVLCIFGSHTFVPISWTCKKQTSVSHSSTGAEIISLDAEPTELLLIGSLTGLIWTQDSNQVCRRHQTSSCRHVDERKFHTWWVEQSSSFV